MSNQPKRFDPIIDDDGIPAMDQFREGDYVLFSDYARLQAEVERLTAEVSYDKRCELHTDRLVAEFTQSEVERLKAEVERLTESLNKMTNAPAEADGVDVRVNFWTKCGLRLPSSYSTFWLTSKEGNQTK